MLLSHLASLRDNPAPLELRTLPPPTPRERDVLIRISRCGVCHTELDEIEGRTPPPHLPIIPGHQVVGTVEQTGRSAQRFKVGTRVGVAWIHSACGRCEFCRRGDENLCEEFVATGRDVNGGYADYMTVPEEFAYNIPDRFTDSEAAPLLCAGAIGYRSLRLTGLVNGQSLGLIGFGASAHIVLQLTRWLYPDSTVFVFTRSEGERAFARELGASWTGDIAAESPEKPNAIIDTTPIWTSIVESLRNLKRGGRLVINAIRKEDNDKDALLRLQYPAHLWLEKEVKSVANVTRRDVAEFLGVAAEIPIRPEVQEFPLEDANRALLELTMRKIRGAKVLCVS